MQLSDRTVKKSERS